MHTLKNLCILHCPWKQTVTKKIIYWHLNCCRPPLVTTRLVSTCGLFSQYLLYKSIFLLLLYFVWLYDSTGYSVALLLVYDEVNNCAKIFELASKVPKQEKSTARKLRLNTFVWYPINFLNRTPFLSLKLVYLLAYMYNLNISGLSEGLRNGTYLQNLQRWLGGEGWPRIESLEAVGSGDRPPQKLHLLYYGITLLWSVWPC